MISKSSALPAIAVIGGTGKQGQSLVYRLAMAGYRLIIGSRDPLKAEAIVKVICEMIDEQPTIIGKSIIDAAKSADIIVLTVPYSAHVETLEQIRPFVQGKLIIDVTVPLMPPAFTKVQPPLAGSAAQEASQILGKDVQVCTAFQNISYKSLRDVDPQACDILVTGTSDEARSTTLELISAAGFLGWDAGPLENSIVVEGMTNVLLNINKRYHSSRAGIKITGVNHE